MSSSYKSIAESGYDPAAYGQAGVGFLDVVELRKRGFNKKEIGDYISEQKAKGLSIGERGQRALDFMESAPTLTGSVRDSGYDPAAYGEAGVGFEDIYELSKRGFGKQQISDYVKGAKAQGLNIGERVEGALSLFGPASKRDDDQTVTTPGGSDSTGGTSTDNNNDNDNNNMPLAGKGFGLAPTEVIEQIRGRGFGLAYLPQQQTGGTIKYGGVPQNLINFNPILSQQANPNINVQSTIGGGVTTTTPGGGGGTPGGGTPDGGTPGGGTPDGGTPDGGTPDGGTPDGGTPDGGTPGGGTPDGGGINNLPLSNVNLNTLQTGTKKFDSINDAKNILAAFNKQTVSPGPKQTKNITDKNIQKQIKQAGIKNFNSQNDAKKFIDHLVKQEQAKQQQTVKQEQARQAAQTQTPKAAQAQTPKAAQKARNEAAKEKRQNQAKAKARAQARKKSSGKKGKKGKK